MKVLVLISLVGGLMLSSCGGSSSKNNANVKEVNPADTIYLGDLRKISGITSKNGRNDAKRLNIRVVTVSNDDKPKNRKTQRKADLRRRMVCKSLPVKE